MSVKIKLKLLLFFLTCFYMGHSQTGKITGKINLLDIENKDFVCDNLYMILSAKNTRDSVNLSNDLSFHFDNLPSDTFYISFSRRSYPHDSRFMIYLGEGEQEKINIDYSSTCPYDKTKDEICPICKKKDEVIPIHYGLIITEIEKNKKPGKRSCFPGGCVVSDCQANWFCERDKKEF